MTPLDLAPRSPSAAWPLAVMGATLLAGGVAALACALGACRGGSRRERGSRWRWLPFLLASILAGGWLAASWACGSSPARTWPLGLAALAGLLVRPRGTQAPAPPGEGHWLPAGLVAMTMLALSGVLLYRLASYSGSLLVWEPALVEHFAERARAGTGVLGFAAGNLWWEEGLVSRGHHSLLYGSLTFALLRLLGASVLTLRVTSVALAVASVGALFLAARRPLGGRAACAAAVMLAISTPLWFYGRYGTAMAETVLGVVVALGCSWSLLDERRDTAWQGAAAAGGLFLATLAYATARLVVIALVAVIVARFLARLRALPARPGLGVPMLLAIAAAVWIAQWRHGTAGSFASASGEQAFACAEDAPCIERTLGRRIAPADLGWRGRAAIAWTMIRTTVPQYLHVLALPFGAPLDAGRALLHDPPELPFLPAPLLLLAALGAVPGRSAWRTPVPASLLTCFGLVSLALLPTTRADAHRMLVLLLPLVVWAAIGLGRADDVSRACGVPAPVRTALAVVFLAGAVWQNALLMILPDSPGRRLADALVDEAARVEGPLAVAPAYGVPGHEIDFHEIGRVNLALLERTRRDPASTGRVLDPELVGALAGAGDASEGAVTAAAVLLREETLLLVPAEPFDPLVAGLRRRGAVAERAGGEEAPCWRVDRIRARTPPAGAAVEGSPFVELPRPVRP